MTVGGGLAVLQYIVYLKSALEILISNEPYPYLVQSLVRYDHPCKKKKKKKNNEHASAIFFRQKMHYSTFYT